MRQRKEKCDVCVWCIIQSFQYVLTAPLLVISIMVMATLYSTVFTLKLR